MGKVAFRFLLLNLGLALYGLAIALQIGAHIGLAPWDALHVGLARKLSGVSVGAASIGVGVVIQFLAWGWLKMPVGIGSVLNSLLIGAWIDWLAPRLPQPRGLVIWGQFLLGIVLVGLATGLYVGARFGAGPRDSLSLGLSRRYGWPVRYVRTGVELVVLAVGAGLGAKIGWGTLLFALLVGPSMQLGLRLLARAPDAPDAGGGVVADQ